MYLFVKLSTPPYFAFLKIVDFYLKSCWRLLDIYDFIKLSRDKFSCISDLRNYWMEVNNIMYTLYIFEDKKNNLGIFTLMMWKLFTEPQVFDFRKFKTN